MFVKVLSLSLAAVLVIVTAAPVDRLRTLDICDTVRNATLLLARVRGTDSEPTISDVIRRLNATSDEDVAKLNNPNRNPNDEEIVDIAHRINNLVNLMNAASDEELNEGAGLGALIYGSNALADYLQRHRKTPKLPNEKPFQVKNPSIF